MEKQHFKDTIVVTRWLRPVGIAIVTCFSYFLAARLGLFLQTEPDGVAVFWPAAGVSSGMLITMGRGARWPVVVGTIAATTAANLTSDRSIWAAIAFGLCNAAEAVVIARLIERFFGADFELGKLRHVAGFMAAAIVATAVSGVGGAVSYKLLHSSEASALVTWQHWFVSDAIGIITVAPLLIGLSEVIRDPPTRRELSEGTAVLLAIVGMTGAIVFLLPGIWWDMVLPVELLFPLLLWITARCRPAFTSAAVFIISLMIVSAATFQFGHFGSVDTPDDRILGAQVGILGVVACALILAALFAERRQQAAVLMDSEGRMRAIINTVVDAIITIDDRGTVETLNPAAARVFGYNPEEVIGRNVKVLMPEPYHSEHDGYIRNYLKTGQAKVGRFGREVVGRRKDGSTFPMELAVSEMIVAGRQMFTGVVREITERKRAEEHRGLMAAELDHRVKNILAQVAAVATSTRRGSRSMDEFVRSLDGRIQSMAAAHRLLSESRWQRVGLAALVQNQLAPYAAEANITISGSDVTLAAPEIQAVAMVLHELVTNAAKHGALSVPDGRVSVSWNRRTIGSSPPILAIEWCELGGPPVTATGQPGYGTVLIRDLVPHELGGTVDLAFATDGVTCKVEFPLEQSSSVGRFRGPNEDVNA